MIFTLFLCIKLSILHLCVSELGYECRKDKTRSDPKIFLVDNKFRPPSGIEHSYEVNLNFNFEHLCASYYNIIRGSLEESKKYTNIIQFAVPDYYDGKPLENFIYAGYVNKKYGAECTKTVKEPKFNCHEMANLVSQSLTEIDYGHIYNLVQGTQLDDLYYDFEKLDTDICEPPFQKPSDLTIVILCFRGYYRKEINIQPLKLFQMEYERCLHNLRKWNMNRLLAVLAPEPFELPSEYSVPTLFYDAPYMFSETKSAFPNSMNLLPWRLLKYGFLKFIQTVGWQRVAIVTDDSEYSIDFEDELTALFSKEQLLYTVIRCEDANCEMEKIAQELYRVSARIVIANVEEKHAHYLFQHAPRRITWLLRDMAGEETKQHLSDDQGAFSFRLDSTNVKGCPGVEDNIITGLSNIAQTHKSIKDWDYNVSKREFYRIFAEKVKNSTARITEAKVVVTRLHDSKEILSMSVKENGETKDFNFDNPYKTDKPSDGIAHCFVSTYDYHKPCGDVVLMLLSFIFMMFVLTILLITCYFEKTSPLNDARYRNF